jgi:hypothetical protein
MTWPVLTFSPTVTPTEASIKCPVGSKDVVAQIEHNGVAGQPVQWNAARKLARRLIRLIGDNADDGPVCHGEDGLIKREVALVY